MIGEQSIFFRILLWLLRASRRGIWWTAIKLSLGSYLGHKPHNSLDSLILNPKGPSFAYDYPLVMFIMEA